MSERRAELRQHIRVALAMVSDLCGYDREAMRRQHDVVQALVKTEADDKPIQALSARLDQAASHDDLPAMTAELAVRALDLLERKEARTSEAAMTIAAGDLGRHLLVEFRRATAIAEGVLGPLAVDTSDLRRACLGCSAEIPFQRLVCPGCEAAAAARGARK